jgi:hypothetical protein
MINNIDCMTTNATNKLDYKWKSCECMHGSFLQYDVPNAAKFIALLFQSYSIRFLKHNR